MHVRTRLKLSKRAKMWPTTYPVRFGQPGSAGSGQDPAQLRRGRSWSSSTRFCRRTRPSRQTLERELDYGAQRGGYRVIYEFQKEDQAVLVVRVDHRARIYRPR